MKIWIEEGSRVNYLGENFGWKNLQTSMALISVRIDLGDSNPCHAFTWQFTSGQPTSSAIFLPCLLLFEG
jgi:hypothetical protein